MLARRHFLMLSALLVSLIGPAAQAQLQSFPKAELTIVSAGGPHKFTVELATTPGQMEQGLMFRKSLRPMPACCSTTGHRRWRRCG